MARWWRLGPSSVRGLSARTSAVCAALRAQARACGRTSGADADDRSAALSGAPRRSSGRGRPVRLGRCRRSCGAGCRPRCGPYQWCP